MKVKKGLTERLIWLGYLETGWKIEDRLNADQSSVLTRYGDLSQNAELFRIICIWNKFIKKKR